MSDDGVGKITVRGVSLDDLFPAPSAAPATPAEMDAIVDAANEPMLAPQAEAEAEVDRVEAELLAQHGMKVVVFDENGPHDLGEQSPSGVHGIIAAALGETDAPVVAKPAKAAKAPKAPKSDALTGEQGRVLLALLNAKVFGDKPMDDRVGVWVRSAAVHDSNRPHGLPMKQIPGVVGGLKKRGLIECGWDKAATVRLTPAALAAGKAR